MWLEIILSVAIGVWIALVLLALSLCRAASRGDEAMWMNMGQATGGGLGPDSGPPSRSDRSLRSLGLEPAASLLGVSTETLLTWQARYGFPTSSASEPRYNQSEVLALRDSLEDGLSIASAVIRARQRTKRRRGATPAPLVDHRDGGLAS
jgi:hypothetical protein